LQRDPTSFPVQYLGANVPQAWAAGTPFMLLQAMLGLQQDAPRGKLYVDPALPDWLPDVTLTDLRLGRRRFDIRFWRDGKETVFNVLKGKSDAVSIRSRFQIGSNSPLAKRNAMTFWTVSFPRKWSIRKIWSSCSVRRMRAFRSRAESRLWPNGFSITTRRQNRCFPFSSSS
jgi:hypothetical protein